MSDVPVEAFVLLSLVWALASWRRLLQGPAGAGPWLAAVGAGLAAGLAVLCKLSGVLALLVLGGWAALAGALPHLPRRRKLAVLGAATAAAVVAMATFVALNPYMTAHPSRSSASGFDVSADWGLGRRAGWIVKHRIDVTRFLQKGFAATALDDPFEKLQVVAMQGYGRFGPLGPRYSDLMNRYDWSQDWGGRLWVPCVFAGAGWALVWGRRQLAAGQPPTAWALLLAAAIVLAVVTAYLPLAWDRYFLPLQSGAALLAAGAIVAAADQVKALVRASWRAC
jgi:hypothetical protein